MRFELPYTDATLEAAVRAAVPALPSDFLWGVATAGYQAEGGFNGDDEPKNNWYRFEGTGGRPATGRASDFWNQYEGDLDRARWMGLNAFRMSIEWARVQPARDPAIDIWRPPAYDEAALDHYALILKSARERGLEPIVTLHHFTHPFWAGRDFWQEGPKVEDYFLPYVQKVVIGLNDRLVDQHGVDPVRYWVTLNEPFMLASGTYLLKMFPTDWSGGRLAAARRAFENVLIGHALAYRAIHAVYGGKRWKRPTVTFNSWAARVYSIDKMAQDLLLAPSLGVKKSDIGRFLAEQRGRFVETVGRAPLPRSGDGVRRAVDATLDALAWRLINPETMQRAVHVAYEDYQDARLLDAVALDYYDPFLSNYVDVGHVREKPWEWTVAPAAFPHFLRAYAEPAHGLPILVLENGFAFRGVTARGEPRGDGARRAAGLKAHLFGVLEALAAGVKVGAFCHWTITDNYEWGSFEPRFGLFAVDYEDGSRRLATDAVGDNAAGAYRALITALATRDPDRVLAAFRAEAPAELYPG